MKIAEAQLDIIEFLNFCKTKKIKPEFRVLVDSARMKRKEVKRPQMKQFWEV